MAIFTHVMLGTNDLVRSKKFYTAALGALGLKEIGPLGERGFMWGDKGPEFMITKPANGLPSTYANGGTLGFAAPDRKSVHAFHKAALAHGGTCEGEPGPRTFTPTAYAAYVRDPDGNKLCAYSFTAE